MFQGYFLTILGGAALTLEPALLSLLFALAAGLAGASAKLSRSAPLRWLATAYTTVVRGVPDLVMMLLVFYGGQLALNELAARLGHADYIDIDPFVAGVLTIGFIFGAYLAETFRGAFLAVPAGQREAGLACGMSRERHPGKAEGTECPERPDAGEDDGLRAGSQEDRPRLQHGHGYGYG